MTIEEIEAACDASKMLNFSRHSLTVPELTHRDMFYPLGFPVELRSNSIEILSQAHNLWSIFEKQFDTKPICVDVHVVEGDSQECPPTPVFRIVPPMLVNIADVDNYSIANLEAGTTQITVSSSTLRQSNYLNHFLLGASPLCHISTSHATPIHAGCVVFNGRGMLLCGDSGAGKSTLSYACARAGWTYIADDATFLLHDREDRLVTGDCHHVRFRPSVAELFPEMEKLEITPRAAGKPSIEVPTAPMVGIVCARTTEVDFLVFLNRRNSNHPELVSYRKDVARYYLRQVLFGSTESLAKQYMELDRLLTAEVFELRYRDLEWAVQRLENLAQEGC